MATESPSSASSPSLPQRPGNDFPAKAKPRPAAAKAGVTLPSRPAKRASASPDARAASKAPAAAASPSPKPTADSPAPKQAAPRDHDDERSIFVAWLQASPAWLISSLVHAMLILLLGLLSLGVPEVRKELSMIVNPSEELVPLDEAMEELDVEIDIDTDDFSDSLAVSDLAAVEPDVNAISDTVGIENAPPAEVAMSEVVSITGPGEASLMDAVPGGGSELGKAGKMAKFFGTESAGDRIAFVVDNSNSMNNGRLETALIEMFRSIEQLTEHQRYFIVFYSDTAYPLYHPSAARGMVRATDENKLRTKLWLQTVQMCLRTNAREAFKLALLHDPDVVYVLGDGAIGDSSDVKLTKKPVPGVVIHALGMQVNEKHSKRFAALAKAHGGTYRDVGITDEGKALLKHAGPRPKNNTFGPIWGHKLPKQKKKK